MSKLHPNYKTFHVYNNVPLTKAWDIDKIDFAFEDECHLKELMRRCQAAHPKCNVWYEIISCSRSTTRTASAYVGKVRIIYKSTETRSTVNQAVVPSDVTIGAFNLTPCGKNRYSLYHRVEKRKHKFVGTLERCQQYVNYYNSAPQCYRDRCYKCKTWTDLCDNTTIINDKPVFGYEHHSQRKPKSEAYTRYKMASGNRYN